MNIPRNRRFPGHRSLVVSGLVAMGLLAVTAHAQENAHASLLESPVKIEPVEGAVATVDCNLPVAGNHSLFGIERMGGTSPARFLVGELFGTHDITMIDESCTLVSSWSTAWPAATMTGVTHDDTTGTYWAVDPQNGVVHEFFDFTGTPTGNMRALPGLGAIWGPICIDWNQPGKIAYVEEISLDRIYEVDLSSGGFGCSFPNPDNFYGNGLSEAADPSACSGATLVVASGEQAAGQVVRASQVDCSGALCRDTWDLKNPLQPYGESFPNGIEEFTSALHGDTRLAVVGNATTSLYVLEPFTGILNCQGIDAPDSDVLFVNGGQGGPAHNVTLAAGTALFGNIVKPPAGGAGKFVVHLNGGIPTSATITTLPAQLGSSCFPLMIPPYGTASPVAIFNNLGKTNRIGPSQYFGLPIPDPPRASTTFLSLPSGDSSNLPAGSTWTVQGVILNPTATSPKHGSVTNAMTITLQ